MTVEVSNMAAWPVSVAARHRRLRVVNLVAGLLLGLEGALSVSSSRAGRTGAPFGSGP